MKPEPGVQVSQEEDERAMFGVEVTCALMLLCGVLWSMGKGAKRFRCLRREQLRERRNKAMLSEANPFFARRVSRWIEHPEKDPDLTWAVQCGEYPDLLVYLKKAANQNK